MAKNSTVLENIELEKGGEISLYMAYNSNNRFNIGFQSGEVETNIWISTEEAQDLADKINKVLSEIE